MPRTTSSRYALDDSSAIADHTVNVSVDGDVRDNKALCQAIVKATGQMLGEISQQIVEFDNERKQADQEAARRLMASTELIAKRMATVEKEILEGQRHTEMMEHLTLLAQLAKEPNHDPILDAIASLKYEPTDLAPVVAELQAMHKKHNRLEEIVLGVQDSHEELHGKHGELRETWSRLQELLHGLQDSHSTLHSKQGKLHTHTSKLEEILGTIHDSQAGLVNKNSELLFHNGQLKDQLLSLEDRHDLLHNRQRELMAAIDGIPAPDLAPFHEHFAVVSDTMAHHGTKVSTIEHRMQMLERSDLEQKQILEAILQRLPVDLDKQLKTLQGDVKATRVAVQQDMGALIEALHVDLKSVHKEVQHLRAETASNAAVMEKEVRKMQQTVADTVKQIAAAMKQHTVDVLTAVEQIETGPELEAITGGVLDKIKKVSLRTDHTPILQALECVPDLHQRMCHVHDKISTSNVHYDHSEVLKAIGKIKPMPDHDTIAAAVHDRLARANLKVDHSDLMRALSRVDVDKALEVHAGDMDSKLRKHHGEFLKAINNIPDREAIVSGVQEKLENTILNVDYNELKQLIRRIPTEHDHDALASAVHDRMGHAIANAGNHSKIMDAIAGLRLDPDLTVVLEAIEAMEESVVSTLLEAIQNIDMQVMCKGGLPASLSPRTKPSGGTSAAKVASVYKEKILRKSTGSSATEWNRLLDAVETREATPQTHREAIMNIAKDTAVPHTARGRMERSASTPIRTLVCGTASPEQEAQSSEGILYACACGYSCGTQSALERHLNRVAGQRGHRAIVP